MQIIFNESELRQILEAHVVALINFGVGPDEEITIQFGGYSYDRNCVVTITEKVVPGSKVEA